LVNINDVDAGENPIKSISDLFAHQLELYNKYKEIEGMDWEGNLVNLHTLEGQKWIKDFLWRTTEELGESFESHLIGDLDHTIEELADALHFFIEVCIISGIEPDTLPSLEEISKAQITSHVKWPMEAYWNTTYHLCLVGNTLKNKPWKKHQMKTDVNKFISLMKESWIALIECFFSHMVLPEDIYDYYFRKNAVNQFRQRSNY